MRKQILLLLFLIPLTLQALPQSSSFVFDDFGGKTELLSVRSLLRQEDGRLWFGTGTGLYSFDGYDVSAHPFPDSPRVIQCLLWQDERLLLGTPDGIYIFRPSDGSFSRLETFGRRNVRKMLSDGHILYCGTEGGFFRFDPDALSIERISEQDVYSLARVGNDIFVGSEGALARYSLSDQRYRILDLDTRIRVIPCILPDGEDLWIGTQNALLRYRPATGEILSSTPLSVVKTVCRGEYGQLLASTDNGLFQIDADTGESRQIRPLVAWDCANDSNGDIWFGTDNGLLLLHQHPVILPLKGLPEDGNARYTTLLRDGRDRLWLGGASGIVLMSPDGTVRHFTMYGDRDRIPHNKVYRIVEDRNTATIYAATDGGYLRYEDASQEFVPLRIEGTHNWIYDLLPDRNGLWAATYEGLFLLDPEGGIRSRYDRRDGLSVDDIQRIVRDRQGDVWLLGRDSRIFRLDPAKDALIPFENDEAPLADCLASDAEGRIWIASGQSLLRIERQEDRADVARTWIQTGPTTVVYALAEVGSRMWACTPEGIASVDKETLETVDLGTYRNYIGLTYDPARRQAVLGAVGSVDIVDLANLQRLLTVRAEAPRLTAILVNGTRRIEGEELETGKLTLHHDENHLEIAFSDFDFNDELPHRFNYRIAGSRGEWSGSILGNKLTLTALNPGRYQLSLAAENASDAPSRLLSLNIRQPWYFSPALLVLYVLLLTGAVLTAIQAGTMRRKLALEQTRRDELLEQSRQKEAFFQDVAHEFKTPLSLIIGPLGNLIRHAQPGTELQTLQLVQDNAMKISTMIHHTIDYYNEAKGVASSLMITEVEFVDFARSIFDSYRDNYPGHEFIFDSSQAEIPARADIVKMETVLNNLLSNACKYTPEGGSVLLTLDRDDLDKRLIIKVSDTGVGIPDNEIPFAFQRYFESSRTKNGGHDSTGIGLSVIKKYVELHGGTVLVSSDAQGTTFTVLLPGLLDTLHDSALPPDLQEEPDKPLVAIIDDNAQICNFIESLLKDRYRCVCSHNGKSGLKLCKDVLPDLIISDVLMPVMDGLEMCRQLRDYGPLSTIPIILLTAKGDRETEQRSIDLNVDVFLPKPFEVETLTARVDQLLTGKKRMEQKIRMEMLAVPSDSRTLSPDERYLQKVTQLIEEHLDDSDLSVGKLCELGGFNEKQLYRKLKQFTGLSAVEYIRSIRLKKAALLLQSGNYTVSEVLYSVGFSNASYFSRAFSAVYKMTPTEYMKSFRDK